MPDGFLYNAGQLGLGDRHLIRGEKAADVIAVEQQRVGAQHGHQPDVLERHQAARRHPARQQHEPAVGAAADQIAERLLVGLLLHELQVVDEQDVPFGGFRRRKVGALGREGQHVLLRRQRPRQRRFAKAAGRAEEKHPPLPQKGVILRLHGGLYDDVFVCHSVPPSPNFPQY